MFLGIECVKLMALEVFERREHLRSVLNAHGTISSPKYWALEIG
jgi:hypothetical protein